MPAEARASRAGVALARSVLRLGLRARDMHTPIRWARCACIGPPRTSHGLRASAGPDRALPCPHEESKTEGDTRRAQQHSLLSHSPESARARSKSRLPRARLSAGFVRRCDRRGASKDTRHERDLAGFCEDCSLRPRHHTRAIQRRHAVAGDGQWQGHGPRSNRKVPPGRC